MYTIFIMRRKVVKHGPSTLIVSLPVSWTKQHGIKGGDEVNVEENGDSLSVSTNSVKKSVNIEIDVSSLDRTSIILYIRSLYRKGYNEIKVNFNKPTATHFSQKKTVKIISVIHEEVARLIGMEVIQQRNKFCIIKEITEGSEKEFDNIVRKISLQLEEAFHDLISALERRDFGMVSTIEEKHDTIAKFVSYCIRIMNQGRLKGHDKLLEMHHLLISYDLVIDILKYFSRDVIKSEHRFDKKSIKILNDMAGMMKQFSKLQFNFKSSEMFEFQRKRDQLKTDLFSLISSQKGDIHYVSYISSLLEISRMMAETVLTTIKEKEYPTSGF